MKPDKSFIQSPLQEGQRVSAMSEPGRQYAPYVNGGDTAALTVDLPKGGGPVALKPKKDRNGITRRILAQ
ncbi:MAG: hypothetical protein FJ386_08580 [Verrucomicrobia bacterium]|nr:hypothetical protein [Verrucomicrobiota bacterium]